MLCFQVLREGKICEFDEPHTLLQNKDSLLYEMVEQTGQAESQHLMTIASEAYLARNQTDPVAIIPNNKCLQLTKDIQVDLNQGTVEV